MPEIGASLNHCPECGYPNDWSEHRCERCGIRFHHHVATAPARVASPASAENPLEFPVVPAAVPPPLPSALTAAPVWRGEVRQRVGRFRERKLMQGSLPFDAPGADLADSPSAGYPSGGYSSGMTPGKVIRFPGSASAEPSQAPALPAALSPAPVATWGPPLPHPSARSATPAAVQQDIAFPRPYAEQTTLLEFPVAALRTRAISALLDGLIVTAGYLLLFVAFYYAGGRTAFTGLSRSALGPFAAVLAILPLLYLHLLDRKSVV